MMALTPLDLPGYSRFVGEVLPEIRREYVGPGRVLFALHQLPSSGTAYGALMDRVAVCSSEPKRFWDFHDRVLHAPLVAQDSALKNFIALARRQTEDFAACISDETLSVGQRAVFSFVGAESQPTFIVGVVNAKTVDVRAVMGGMVPYEQFLKVFRTLGVPSP
jgi:hypothetical protein